MTDQPRGRRLAWVLIALVAVAVLVGSFFAVRAVASTENPSAPTGLKLVKQPGRVQASWDEVPGADSYQLVRGDVVAYAGDKNSGIDQTVTQGKQVYRVYAVSDGVRSPASAEATIEAGDGWGASGPLFAQFPKLLPQAPSFTGEWEGSRCVRRYSADESERGASAHGASDEVRTVFTTRCTAGSVYKQFGMFWYASKDAVNAVFARTSDTYSPVKWNHGTGSINAAKGRGQFKIADNPEQELVVIVVLADTPEEILKLVNSMPLGS